jgi:hypothetical protein
MVIEHELELDANLFPEGKVLIFAEAVASIRDPDGGPVVGEGCTCIAFGELSSASVQAPNCLDADQLDLVPLGLGPVVPGTFGLVEAARSIPPPGGGAPIRGPLVALSVPMFSCSHEDEGRCRDFSGVPITVELIDGPTDLELPALVETEANAQVEIDLVGAGCTSSTSVQLRMGVVGTDAELFVQATCP